MLLQAALIVLPLAAISIVAILGLRQDKSAILREATTRTVSQARDLTVHLTMRASQLFAAEKALEGTVVDVPIPPAWPDQLSAPDAQRWKQAQAAIFQHPNSVAARTALNNLQLFSTSPDLRANAALAIRLLDEPFHANRFVDLAQRYPQVFTDSGAPLAAVALFAALRAGRGGPLPEGFIAELTRQVRTSPSFLTVQILEEAGKVANPPAELASLRQEWSAWQQYMDAVRATHIIAPSGVPQLVQRGKYLAWTTPVPGGSKVDLLAVDAVQGAFSHAFADLHPSLFVSGSVASVEFAGRRWPLTGSSRKPVLLAAVPGSVNLGGPRAFRLLIEADDASLYSGYRSRLWLMTALIVCAALASLIGLATLLRGYHRETCLNELKSNFVSSVSHELRAPLGAVRLMAENLERERISDPTQQKEYFRLIGQECRRVSALVENMLDFSRMESGRKEYTFESVDLLPLLSHTIALMQPFAAERGVNLHFTPPPSDLPQPSWDAAAIQQCLVNLLDNAIKHSPPSAAVTLEVEFTESALRLWVRDQGPGIPPEDHSRVFDLFYRRGSELRRETAGAGIGLSIVKHVAEAHGGRVVLVSQPGDGSNFALELPYRRVHV